MSVLDDLARWHAFELARAEAEALGVCTIGWRAAWAAGEPLPVAVVPRVDPVPPAEPLDSDGYSLAHLTPAQLARVEALRARRAREKARDPRRSHR